MRFIGFDYLESDIEWRKIILKNGDITKYSVSNIGIVRNDKNNKIIKSRIGYNGYVRVPLSHNGKAKGYLLHRLVANAFIPNPDEKPEVNHIDGIKYNNQVYNLEWCTRSENERHAFKTGLNKGVKFNHKLIEDTIRSICKLIEDGYSVKYISKNTGISRTVIKRIIDKKIYTNISNDYNLDNYDNTKLYITYGDNNNRTKYPDKDIIYVCELIDSGKYDMRHISEISNVDYQTVRNVYYGVCRNNIAKNYKFYNRKRSDHPLYNKRKEMVIKICELLDKGYNSFQIEKILGVPASTIRKIHSGTNWKNISKDYNFMK